MIKVDLLNLQDSQTLSLDENETLKEQLTKDLDSSKFGDVFKILQINGKIFLHPLKHGFADVLVDINAKIKASCDVCGEETEISLSGSEKFLARARKKSKSSKLEHELDLSREELDEIFLEEAKFLDLISVIRDSIFMNTPSKITCVQHQELKVDIADNLALNTESESVPRYQSSKDAKAGQRREIESSPFSILEDLKKNLKH
jgi:uncharacterized metal-binding protein YceD (DUF177 family)